MKTTQLPQLFARNLDLIRHSRGVDAESFAREAGVSRQQISLWRTGRNAATLLTVGSIAARLGWKASALLEEEPSDVLRGRVNGGRG